MFLQCGQTLHHWSDTFKSSFAHSRKIAALKFWSLSWCLLYLQSYLEISFVTKRLQCPCWKPTICHWFVDVVIWPVMIACNWENCVLGQNTHHWFRPNGVPMMYPITYGDGLRCAPNRALICFFDIALPSERKKPSWIAWTIEISPSTCWVFPGRFLARTAAQVEFLGEPSHNLLCPTILDIMSTSCACALSLRHAPSPPPHAARGRARAAAGPSTFWRRASLWVSLNATGCSY